MYLGFFWLSQPKNKDLFSQSSLVKCWSSSVSKALLSLCRLCPWSLVKHCLFPYTMCGKKSKPFQTHVQFPGRRKQLTLFKHWEPVSEVESTPVSRFGPINLALQLMKELNYPFLPLVTVKIVKCFHWTFHLSEAAFLLLGPSKPHRTQLKDSQLLLWACPHLA